MDRQKYTEEVIHANLRTVPGWAYENGQITRTFQLPSFPAALLFVNTVGHFAEQVGHHPDIDIRYNKVKLSISTHDVGGITDKDFALARRITPLYSQE
jgi:4a-hydroxytetrahydrobiopterin dehydratase